LLAGADDGQRMRIRIGQQLGRNSARCAGAHLPEQIGLDDPLELAVERGVEQRVKLRALHSGIGLEAVHPVRTIGGAHQVEGAARQSRALPRQIAGRGLPPGGEQCFERRNGVFDGDQPAHVRFGEIDRRCRHCRIPAWSRTGRIRLAA